MNTQKIRTILIEDETLLRTLLRRALEASDGFDVCGEAEDGERGLELCRSLYPGLILLDIHLPKLGGIALAHQLRQELPEIRIVVLSSRHDPDTVRRVLQTGVHGFIDKRQTLETLVNGIREVAQGSRYYSKQALEVLSQMIKPPSGSEKDLTAREKEILKLLAQGLTSKGIAFELSISELTVKTHRQNIHRKLDIHDTAGLTRYAIELGLI